MTQTATARAHPNIALVKYWGKRDGPGNVPAVPSLSITLDGMSTTTTVTFDAQLHTDQFMLDGAAAGKAELQRVSACLDRMWSRPDPRPPASVSSHNDFPTGAGLASSASGFAALVVAADAAMAEQLEVGEQSVFARISSASAARSLFGGFATLDPDCGCRAAALKPPDHWPLEVVVAVCASGRKSVGSTDGMRQSRDTSPFYSSWVDSARQDFLLARDAVAARDFAELARITESSTHKMHAVMHTTEPALIYWNAGTLACIRALRDIREAGTNVFYTMDAGPQVKAICAPGEGLEVANQLRAVPGVMRIITSGLGSAAKLLSRAI